MTRRSISQQAETSVLALSRRRCALCFGLGGDLTVKTGQIAHIDQDSSNDSVTSQSKGYTANELRHYREELYDCVKSILPRDSANADVSLGAAPLISPQSRTFHNEALLEFRDYIRSLVNGAFVPEEDIPQLAIDGLSDEYDADSLKPYAAILTQEDLAQHEKDQESWPATTDCDRLDLAFEALEGSGILCRQDYQCCLSCGYARIAAELDEIGRGRFRGFTFYHQQDTNEAVETGSIGLGYGSVTHDEGQSIAIGHEIVSALREQGLKVDWTGSLDKRIIVQLDWKRRR
jgi:hypothetical protein